ncbi:hypothetical protein BDV28DRAFT_126450 [Aspergillus coremiiformis]|uniref:Uncharacterized protein n=1 Tax=Aspergillus coremiiformis TaxID=138285 RepID=A0A5N6ZKP1_9EURO|nr:hypothetical protein BDV28DRAFT_126450 [Aspergillus coremiiformis]
MRHDSLFPRCHCSIHDTEGGWCGLRGFAVNGLQSSMLRAWRALCSTSCYLILAFGVWWRTRLLVSYVAQSLLFELALWTEALRGDVGGGLFVSSKRFLFDSVSQVELQHIKIIVLFRLCSAWSV